MQIRDYNGSGCWSRQGILAKYQGYAQRYRIEHSQDLTPRGAQEGTVKWVYPVMERVIDGIEAGDKACVDIGLDFIEEDQHFPFGKILKSNVARALRRAELSSGQQERIRHRIVGMLVAGNVPHEYKEYAKLLRKVGIGDRWREIEEGIDRTNPYVMKYYEYFRKHA